MSNNLGRLVKWQDPEDQGWHTGREVLLPDGKVLARGFLCYDRLIQESCDGKLTWVDVRLLQDWPTRNEWEEDTEQQMVLNQIEHNYA